MYLNFIRIKNHLIVCVCVLDHGLVCFITSLRLVPSMLLIIAAYRPGLFQSQAFFFFLLHPPISSPFPRVPTTVSFMTGLISLDKVLTNIKVVAVGGILNINRSQISCLEFARTNDCMIA